MKTILLQLLSTVLLFYFTGCAYNTRDENPAPPTGNSCDTTRKFLYARDIRPILQDQACEDCHMPGGTFPNISDSTSLRNYINSKKTVFTASVKFEGNHPMPKGGPEMPDSLQKKIINWICQGMK